MDLAAVTAVLPAADARWRRGDAWLAGGTWLFSEPQPDLRRLLDLRAFGWPSLTVTDDGGLEMAATCTLAELAAFSPPPAWTAWEVVGPCLDSLLGSFKVMNMATVGGNLCLALPAAPIAALATGLDGTCTIWSAGRAGHGTRTLPARDVVLGPRHTALLPGELLRSIRLPTAALGSRAVFRRASLASHGRSAAIVLARQAPDGAVSVTVTASTPRPVELRFERPPPRDEALAALDSAVAGLYLDDVHGLGPWRAAMTRHLVGEALEELREVPA
ncbi:MAG: FAD binding domain-containing protein [Kineosporiaceae bacterium]